jgi:hypothetical protein
MAANARLSIAGLCREAGVAPATATRWKSGVAAPTMRIWDKLERSAKAAADRRKCPQCHSEDTEPVATNAHPKMRACCACFTCYLEGEKE